MSQERDIFQSFEHLHTPESATLIEIFKSKTNNWRAGRIAIAGDLDVDVNFYDPYHNMVLVADDRVARLMICENFGGDDLDELINDYEFRWSGKVNDDWFSNSHLWLSITEDEEIVDVKHYSTKLPGFKVYLATQSFYLRVNPLEWINNFLQEVKQISENHYAKLAYLKTECLNT